MEQHYESAIQVLTNPSSFALSNKIEVQQQVTQVSSSSFYDAVDINSGSSGSDIQCDSQEISRCHYSPNKVELFRARQQLRDLKDCIKMGDKMPHSIVERRIKEEQLRTLIKNLELSEQHLLRKRAKNSRINHTRSRRFSSNASSTPDMSEKEFNTGLPDPWIKDKSVNKEKERTELSLENSTVLSYQHFQEHLSSPSTGLQADNVLMNNSNVDTNIETLCKAENVTEMRTVTKPQEFSEQKTEQFQKANVHERKRITKVGFNADTISFKSYPKKIALLSEKTMVSDGHDTSSNNRWNTNKYANDFVSTQFFKREREITEEEEMLYDPLQINVSSVKVEPSDVTTNVKVAFDDIGLASDFVAVEMKTIKQSNSIPSDGDNEFSENNGKTNFNLAVQGERKRIERAFQQTNEVESFLVMDIKAEVEEFTWNPLQSSTVCTEEANLSPEMAVTPALQAERMRKNNKKIKKDSIKRNKRQRKSIDLIRLKKHKIQTEVVGQGMKQLDKIRLTRSKTKVNKAQVDIKTEEDFKWNPLHRYLESSSCDEEPSVSLETLAKRELQAERMRKNNEKIKSEAIKRKLRQQRSIGLVRLKKLETQEENFLQEGKKEIGIFRLTRSKAKVETQDSEKTQNSFEIESTEERLGEIPKQRNKSHQKKQRLGVDVDFDSDSSLAEKRKLWAARMRERRARETPEETETRRLKARIAKMKSRLVAQLIISEEEMKAENARKAEEMRLMRQKRREAETPEQTAARKLKQSLQARKSRNRLEAAETPEETAKRKAVRAAYLKKRKEEVKSKESPEEQALRKEQRKKQRRLYKERKIKQKVRATAEEENIITVRATATEPEAINNDLAYSWNNNTPTEFNLNNTFNNG